MSRAFNTIEWLSDFPPGLDTKTDPVDLKDGFTPDAFGLDLDSDNRLAKAAIPTGTARIKREVTIGADTYSWLYRRAWRISANSLIYGAYRYDNIFYKQGLSEELFDEDSSAIVQFLPFGGNSMAVMKSTGSHVLRNADDIQARFSISDIMQEVKLETAANSVELDGVAYASASAGLFSFTGGQEVKDITRRVRDSVTSFANIALTADYDKKRIIGTNKFVYDVEKDRLFDYGTTGFRWTSPTFHLDQFEPFMIERLLFTVEHTDTDNAQFKYQVKHEDEDFQLEETVAVLEENNRFTTIPVSMLQRVNVRRFVLKINDMDSNIKIRNIFIELSGSPQGGYSK